MSCYNVQHLLCELLTHFQALCGIIVRSAYFFFSMNDHLTRSEWCRLHESFKSSVSHQVEAAAPKKEGRQAGRRDGALASQLPDWFLGNAEYQTRPCAEGSGSRRGCRPEGLSRSVFSELADLDSIEWLFLSP